MVSTIEGPVTGISVSWWDETQGSESMEIPRVLETRVVRYGAALVLLVGFIALSPDFGATWDERALQTLGEQIWEYFHGRIRIGD